MEVVTPLGILFLLVVVVVSGQPEANKKVSRVRRQLYCASPEFFSCPTGECIESRFLCDGKKHCADNADESDYNCRQVRPSCLVRKKSPGTSYSEVDCKKNPWECPNTFSGILVRMTCAPGYTVPQSVNITHDFQCPSMRWNRRIDFCTRCSPSKLPPGRESVRPGVRHSFIQSHPWHVGIFRKSGRNLICGGSLITPGVIISAASCFFTTGSVYQVNPKQFEVLAGSSVLEPDEEDTLYQTRSVRVIRSIHDAGGDSISYLDDIAIAKVERDFVLSDRINLICMRSHLPYPLLLKIPGWSLSKDDSISHSLKAGDFRVETVKLCRKRPDALKLVRYFTYDKFCILRNDDSDGLGATDSGSGLTMNIDGVEYLYGVVSVKASTKGYTVVTNVTKHVSWIQNTLDQFNELLEKSECQEETHFKCSDGSCISRNLLCDGIDNCDGGQDESGEICEDDGQIFEKRPDGSCYIPKQRGRLVNKCDSGKTCADSFEPGSWIPSGSSFQVTCKRHFGLQGSTNRIACLHSVFYPNLPDCIKLCRPLQSQSLDIDCSKHGNKTFCGELMFPGTTAKITCREHYSARPKEERLFTQNVCLANGRWKNPLPTCDPLCGKKTEFGATPLISKGEKVKVSAHPWNVGLYRYDEGEGFEHICGGSIISPNTVITAAHCVVNRKNVVRASSLKVVAGKYYRSYSKKEDYAQEADIERIVMDKYFGEESNFGRDIAVLFLKSSFSLNKFVLPVCTSNEVLPTKGIGEVVGWGLTEKNENSEELLGLNLTYVDLQECRQKAKREFRKYLTPDKFCILYKDGGGVQRGDSGSGFTVSHGGLSYLYGVVSVKPPSENTFAGMTLFHDHRQWIDDITS